MRPTLEAQGLKESLLQYLSTTYALTDEGARESLHRFLGDETAGMFRGPFLRIRAPFVTADASWRDSLDWRPDNWTPYAHQAAAFARLTSAHDHTPQPTLVTTGTGSGKTEAFLYPVLDHCIREKAAGRDGIKAVILYPMNALAADQAQRLNDLLVEHQELARLRSGLYIGEKAATTYEKVYTNRSDMWLSPPDILLTNYKMLDMLLQRSYDAPLWTDADLRYVVVDEFHTYDGAQGTDVAMLLRRLAAAVGASEPGRPLGRICPVATSATLASGRSQDDQTNLLEVATQIFGTEFTADAVIGEDRQSVEEFIPTEGFDPLLPMPLPEQLAALPDPSKNPDAAADLVEAVTGERGLDPFELGKKLKKHVLTSAVLHSLTDGVRTNAEILNRMWRANAQSWVQTITRQPDVAATALARFVALLSIARDPASKAEHPRPFVHVEVHQWARSVSRLVRGVQPWPEAEFRWDSPGATDLQSSIHARTTPVTVATSGQPANLFLPAIYCRECGRSGWAVFSPESDDQEVEFDTHKTRLASTGRDKVRVRNLIAATNHEAREVFTTAPVTGRSDTGALGQGAGGALMVLDGLRHRLRPPDPGNDYSPQGEPRLAARDSTFVLVNLGPTANTAASQDWCPACGEHNAIRYLGTGAAALAAACVTQLFTGGELDPELGEEKTLMFNDSVQDAAHRAGFVASRSYTFSLRALFKKHLFEEDQTPLNDLIADVVAATTDPQTLRAVVPTDLHDLRGVSKLLSGQGGGRNLPTWRLVGERLAFEALMEFGFRSRNGRTLELTRTAAAHVRIPDAELAIELVKATHLEPTKADVPLIMQDDARYLAFLRVFLERLRTRGAVKHQWLANYLREAGTSRYHIWGGRPEGMRAFPRGIAAPIFLINQPKAGSEFDFATGRLSWYERWTQRCLELPREMVPDFWNRLLPQLATAGVLSVATPNDSSVRIYGLQPGNIGIQLLTDDAVNVAFVRCPVCFWEQTVHPTLLDQWHGQPCPSYRCRAGRLIAGDRPEELGVHHRDRDYRNDYYRHLYRKAGTYQVITAEHTGMLSRAERERVEAAFRHGTGFRDPNVLSCTPTLEMGIDIGDLSAVVLAALPRRPANYAQQVGRAGRRTGNAFLLTIPDRRRRDLYFLEQPQEMIAGQIIPPGCYLSAIEILRRQYLAHLLDLAARGRLIRGDGIPLRALPSHAPALFGPSGYLRDLVELAVAQGDRLVEDFLGLFPTGVTDEAKADLHAFATRGLRGKVEEAERAWRDAEEVLRTRLKLIDEAHDELHDSDPEQLQQKKELDGERRAVSKKLTGLGLTLAQNAMCDLGLLPNYALIDAVTTLNATLYWPEVNERTGKNWYTSALRSYSRPQRFALSELAPGNTFYVNGYKHEIGGLEIGTAARPQWRNWRFCQDCGYVRTENAVDDRSPCPRCNSTRIADDGSCLHKVVEPSIVTSRDKREDARIGDDRDDRDQRLFSVIDAVDIPLEAIDPGTSWRHATQTFGVDYCRTTVIRRVNVGEARFDRQVEDDLAGQSVRLSPFYVCTGCGAATADGRPVFDHHPDALNSSAARNPQLKHHLPWCRLRRGKSPESVPQEPVLLAHELRTEALRILLPAVTVLVEEKVHSFRAALRLGVDKHFGGDPQHLDTTLASMPDAASGERRYFLVLYDRLPGGTGYLHRLTGADAMKATLLEARRVLLNCPCQDEGRRACHRCLHRYTDERYQDIVSRREALEILNDLLGPIDERGNVLDDTWVTDKVPTTDLIGLDGQVESDLEARFLAALRQWVTTDGTAALDEDGRASGYLRFADSAGIVSWRLTAQRSHGYTRTDFTFERTDGPRQTVTVYVDGYNFHATGERNRVATDGNKRNQLRADGGIIFQVTWTDLDLFENRKTDAEPVWPPYRGNAQNQAKDVYEQLGGRRADLADAVFVNPIETLLAYLRQPDGAIWARGAKALVSGLMTSASPIAQGVNRTGARQALQAELASNRGNSPAKALEASNGPVHIMRSTDLHGLSLVFTLDSANGTSAADVRWSAIAILDDTADAMDADDYRLRWRSWLYWSNLLQFLGYAGGDGIQLATSSAAGYPVEVLAVCGGVGELGSFVDKVKPRSPAGPAGGSKRRLSEVASISASAEPVLRSLVRDSRWDKEILPILEVDEPDSELTELARELAAQGKQAPVFGYELGERGWQVDFGWEVLKVAVVPKVHESPDEEARKRDEAYEEAGWTVRTAADWLDDFDMLLQLLPDAEGTVSP
ncbi:DEAD/DEAH box helicase [Fodinicola acaciae]|uniref:DEAD/DEAH box helicase n=1 Tax=Fodinicola acaciae TaxID=2681555 RepID=UPI0013D7C6DB|nr:DEAD/DEAH box helicase [Fodinicola acaciae]